MSQQFYVITLTWQNFVIFYSPPMPRATNMFLYLAPTNLRLLDPFYHPKGLKWFERDLLHSQRVQRKGKYNYLARVAISGIFIIANEKITQL